MSNVMAVASVVMRELYRRKDVYVLLIMTAVVTMVAGSVNIFNDAKIVRYVKEICLLLIWISMIVVAITMAARQIPMERESRTIFPLLAKPITRTQVLLGKFLGAWIACGIALLVFYTFFAVVCLARESNWLVMNYVQAMLLQWFMIGIVLSMTLLGSLVFAAPSSTNTIMLTFCAAELMIGRHLNKVAISLPEPPQSILYALYFCIPHMEFFDVRDLIIHDWPLLPWTMIGLAAVYAVAYTGFFLAIACLIFRRQNLS